VFPSPVDRHTLPSKQANSLVVLILETRTNPAWIIQTGEMLERETGLEPATTCLEGRDSTN
jgi:hypothetical protein